MAAAAGAARDFAGLRGGGSTCPLGGERTHYAVGHAQMAKESLNRGLDIPNLSDASLVDLYRFMALEATEDKDEGHRAWREKRKPVFRGR